MTVALMSWLAAAFGVGLLRRGHPTGWPLVAISAVVALVGAVSLDEPGIVVFALAGLLILEGANQHDSRHLLGLAVFSLGGLLVVVSIGLFAA